MDDGCGVGRNERRRALNLLAVCCELEHGRTCVTRLAERPLQGDLWNFDVEKVTEEYVGCLLMVLLYFIAIYSSCKVKDAVRRLLAAVSRWAAGRT